MLFILQHAVTYMSNPGVSRECLLQHALGTPIKPLQDRRVHVMTACYIHAASSICAATNRCRLYKAVAFEHQDSMNCLWEEMLIAQRQKQKLQPCRAESWIWYLGCSRLPKLSADPMILSKDNLTPGPPCTASAAGLLMTSSSPSL